MIKAALVSLGILILCGLENIGHYFGICFHGWTAQIIGCLGGVAFGLSMYFQNLQAWLVSRNANSWSVSHKESRPHKCNSVHHAQRDADDLAKHLRKKFLKKE